MWINHKNTTERQNPRQLVSVVYMNQAYNINIQCNGATTGLISCW